MRIVPLVVATFLLLQTAAIAGEIREFKIQTLEKLGNEISRRDEIAAKASDVVLETQPAARALKLRGWISELGKDEDKVHIITETASGPCLAYTVSFAGSKKPVVEDRRGESLPQNVAVRYKALQTTLVALNGKLFDANYNYEVLDDPDGSGFLVYALAATKNRDEQILGGHFRVTVSADGSTAEQVDALSRGIIKEKPKMPAGAKQESIVITQLVSDIPVETFIYSSHLFQLPIYVGTMDKTVWRVVNGKIEKLDPKLVKETEAKSKKKK
jgi:hypothetical protein